MSLPAFLISHRGALGDFLLTWPALIALRKKYCSHRFVGLGRPEYLKLARHFALFDEIHDCESRDLLDFYSAKSIPEFLKPLDLALCFMEKDQVFEHFLRSIGVHSICLHPPFPKNGKWHVADYHCQILQHFSLPILKHTNLFLPMASRTENYVIIHPGSGSSRKNFDPEFYAFIAGELINMNLRDIRFVLGPLEKNLRAVFKDRFTIIETSGLIELAENLSRSRLFIGNDSGVTHLAAFLGIPTLALFKSTAPAIWGTRGLRTENIEAPTESLAMAKIQKILPSLIGQK
jgi:ADP-heptose:LPS heptosyltransferase